MLVGGTLFARHRVAFLLAVTTGFGSIALCWYLAARIGWVSWPSGTGDVGFACGIVAGAIVFFEMFLWVRKKLRRWRWLGTTRTWMFLHIWLGLVSLPLAIGHSGFALGGSLSAAVMILFLLVIASGVWGLAMQQIIPRKLLEEIPGETIVTELDRVMPQFLAEAETLVARIRTINDEDAAGGGTVVRAGVSRTDQLTSFFQRQIVPYLLQGKRGSAMLAARARASQVFAELRRDSTEEWLEVVDGLEAICDVRRQIDLQARLQFWLHNWLCIHLPLSVALTVLLGAHIVFALKFW